RGRRILRQVEIQAFSVEEAVRLALEQLGRTRDQVNVEVLATDPGSEEVLVRVTAREVRGSEVAEEEASPRERRAPTAPRPGDRRDRDRDRDRDRGGRDERVRGGRVAGRERPVERPMPAPVAGVRTAPYAEEEFGEEDN